MNYMSSAPMSPGSEHGSSMSGGGGSGGSGGVFMPHGMPPGHESGEFESLSSDIVISGVPREVVIAAWFDAMKDAGLRSGRSKCSVCVAINACTDVRAPFPLPPHPPPPHHTHTPPPLHSGVRVSSRALTACSLR
jgi:hypothetical protein